MPLRRHLTAAAILGAITTNLVLWIVPLVLLTLARALAPAPGFRTACTRTIDHIYRLAVHVDSFLLQRTLGIDIRIHGDRPVDSRQTCIVVSNHRSWFDILLLQHTITGQGPILKFLIKRELVWVPVVGWICLALDFPRLERGRRAGGRERDLNSVVAATVGLRDSPGALVSFAEGTRFTRRKHQERGSDFRHLLNPRAGGLTVMLEELPDVPVIDVTIIYSTDDISFWRCLAGELKSVDLILNACHANDIADVREWLNERWRAKDELIERRVWDETPPC